MLRRFIAPLLLGLLSWHAAAAEEGLLDLVADSASGQVLLHFETLPVEYLYVAALQSGAGSNDLGLDRGKMDRTRLVRFERFGNRVLLIEPNMAFRADTENAFERRAVDEAFAQSVLAGFEITEDVSHGVTIDLSSLLISDIVRIADQISSLEQGDFAIDPDRSAVITDKVRNFPDNTLLPAIVTLKGTAPGAFVNDVTPTPDSLTLRISHQFIRLPDDGFESRAFHPRSGYFALTFRDYAAPLGQTMDQRLIYRHRLAPGDTLRYYVDNGTPEPVRSALLEGASWWGEAFENAGFENGFSVEVLPQDADPLDIRYNAIQWVHRSTRGWSYGGSVADPRTGEIIKGHVSLGSLRVRQDQLIAEALTAPFSDSGGQADSAQEMALARLRQLSAHEVGHTLGIDHNFAASFSGDASVMDYPHPNLYLDDSNNIRLDRAYTSGVSPWDKLVIRYGYSLFPQGDEAQKLAGILDEARNQHISFLGDRDARNPGSAHPGAHLWDNGNDVLGRLGELLTIRRVGLDNFSAATLPPGTPLFEMERRLVPVFLLHRYQLEATAKLLGGLQYEYAIKGEGEPALQPVDATTQLQALDAMLSLLRPEQLALPRSLLYLVPPPVLEYSRDREYFGGNTGTAFDHLAPSRAGANLVIRELLQAQRLARLNEQHALESNLPGHEAVLDALVESSWYKASSRDSYLSAIQAETNWLVLRGLMTLAADASAGDVVRASGTATLMELADKLGEKGYRGNRQATAARREILRFLEKQPTEIQTAPDSVPPGSPIG